MKICSVRLITFSPTQTTRRVVEGIARGVQAERVGHIDLTPPEAREREYEELGDELAILGAPVYGGRIPIEAVRRLRRLKGAGTLAALVVVYGNRAYEDALLELRDLAIEVGFVPMAGGAFIGEHSFSSDETPIAEGRPDAKDLARAAEFGAAIREKVRDMDALDKVPSLHVPGDLPYVDRGKPRQVSPLTREALCTRCGTCATVCPTAAVTVSDVVITDQSACILCCACVKSCPTGARALEDPRVRRSMRWLSKNCRARQEPELYL
jgi:ferredoxin